MAGFLDIGVLAGANLIFAFIFVWAIVFAVLSWTNWLGDGNKHLYSLIALVVAFMTLFSSDILKIITQIIPWFVLVIIFVVMLVIVVMSTGATKENIQSVVTSNNWGSIIAIWAIVVSIIIVAGAIGNTYFSDGANPLGGSAESDTGVIIDPETGTVIRGSVEDEGSGALFATIFHPKILGFLLVMIIAIFLVNQMGKGVFV